jgi:hypothetical protein
MQNAIKHLFQLQKDKEPSPLSDFSAYIFEYEDKATFGEKFAILRTKMHKQTWLNSIYKVEEKWAKCYMENVYTLGM